MTLPPTYNAKEFEDKIYQQWQSEGVGSPEVQVDRQSTKPKVLFATTNHHKIRLFKMTWENQGLNKKYTLLTLQDLPKIDLGYIAEDSGTFAGDAEIKAKAYAKAYNLPTISQDRGFIFDVLNWPRTDTKKVFTLDETKEFKQGKWGEVKDEYFERSKEILSKIDGVDRSMSVIQGIAICLPNGEFVSEEFIFTGQASLESKASISGAGGMYDWFFIPNGLDHTISEFSTREAQDEYCANVLYPITQKIVEFMATKLQNDTYSTLMPPPNLTGGLHAGHAFQHYLMDTLTRVHRQKGQKSLWYPGVDHAGIQLEGVIDKLIKKGEFDDVLKEYGAEEGDE